METPIRIAVCEDTQEDAELLLRYISESDVPVECRHFSTCEALEKDFSPGKYDLIFLDIYDGNVQKGVDLAAKIRAVDASVTLVFTTFSTEHALEGYRLRVFAYLEKPVDPAAVQEILKHSVTKRKSAPAIRLLINRRERKILLHTVLYFEQKNHAVYVNTRTGVLRTSQSVKLNDIEPLLPDWFFRSHHSFIANLRYVKELDRELRVFQMQNGDAVYIRRSSLGEAVKAYERQLFAAAREEDV